MEPMSDDAQLQLHFVDSVQRRYEVIRPIVLISDRTAAQRAEEPHLYPETVRDLTRRFRQQGMLGLFPEQTEIVICQIEVCSEYVCFFPKSIYIYK